MTPRPQLDFDLHKQPQTKTARSPKMMNRAKSMMLGIIHDDVRFDNDMDASTGERSTSVDLVDGPEENADPPPTGLDFLQAFAAAERADGIPPTSARARASRRVKSATSSLPLFRKFGRLAVSSIHTEQDIVDGASRTEMNEVGIDRSIQGRRPFRRGYPPSSSRSSSTWSSWSGGIDDSTNEVGIDRSIQGRVPFQRGYPSSASHSSSWSSGLDNSFRRP